MPRFKDPNLEETDPLLFLPGIAWILLTVVVPLISIWVARRRNRRRAAQASNGVVLNNLHPVVQDDGDVRGGDGDSSTLCDEDALVEIDEQIEGGDLSQRPQHSLPNRGSVSQLGREEQSHESQHSLTPQISPSHSPGPQPLPRHSLQSTPADLSPAVEGPTESENNASLPQLPSSSDITTPYQNQTATWSPLQ